MDLRESSVGFLGVLVRFSLWTVMAQRAGPW